VSVSDFSDAVVAVTTGIGTLASTAVLVYRTGFAPKRASKAAATETAEKLLEALADGDLSPEELHDIQRDLRKEEEP
jgi:hypothetical protein